jgi:hypothetical protein
MNANISLIQRVLGEDWAALPAVIQRHYQIAEPQQAIVVTGNMSIDYPLWIAPVLKLLRLLGALVDLKGEQMAVQVKKWRQTTRRYFIGNDIFRLIMASSASSLHA